MADTDYYFRYVSDGIERNGLPFGRHKRVYIYQEVPDWQSIISLEASGDQVERLPNTWDEQGRTLVMGEVPNFPRRIRANRPG